MNERIKELRKLLELNQTDFGNRLGVAAAAISKLEKGVNALTEQMILSICREFGVNEDWLRYGEGEMFAEDINSTLGQVVKEYNLDNLDRAILESYIKLPDNKRKVAKELLKNFARYILDEDIERVQSHVIGQLLNHMNFSEEMKGSVEREVNNSFNAVFPSINVATAEPVNTELDRKAQADLLRARADAIEKGVAESTTFEKDA